MLCVRALTPDGYMPGSKDSGLLFELCPSGMPQEVMRVLAGGHHHQQHGAGEGGSAASTEQCPIGHMLGSAVAADVSTPSDMLPETPLFVSETVAPCRARAAVAYHSRAPPA